MNENRRQTPSADSGGHIRALALLGAAAAVFFFALILCITLIAQSADVAQNPTQAVSPLEYEVRDPGQVPTMPTTSITDEGIVTVDLEAPVSVNDSSQINILLMGVEGDKNDTLIIVGVDTVDRTVSFLSIPRDTYIFGDYELPKVKQVYRSFDAERRVAAVKEAVKDMLGFWVDYYFVLDEATLSAMVTFVDGVEYDVPKDPAYHSLPSGRQTVRADQAFELFRFKQGWTDVETDPPRVQRYFLQKLFAELLEDETAIAKHCLELAQIAKTDLTAGQMAYLAFLLSDFDFENAFSRALPGGEKTIDKITYYEVDIDSAVQMLNEELNPLAKDLTVYNVHFRQEQGATGEGQYSDYGPITTTTTQADESEPTEENETSEPEPEETDSDTDE